MTDRARPAAGARAALDRWIPRLGLAYLWAGLAFDLTITILAWTSPQIWFGFFHEGTPQGLEIALLRRAAGQWAAFALVQALALALWKRDPIWLVIVAGARFSDVFTDLSYLIASPALTPCGVLVLLPLPLVNTASVLLLLRWRALVKDPRGDGAQDIGRAT